MRRKQNWGRWYFFNIAAVLLVLVGSSGSRPVTGRVLRSQRKRLIIVGIPGVETASPKPPVLRNQLEGGALHGVSRALLEEVTWAVVPDAIANAVFDATGARTRQIPLTPERVRTGLAARA